MMKPKRRWRALWVICALLLALAFFLRAPEKVARDGRDDRGHNGVVLDPGWSASEVVTMGEFARAMREHRMGELCLTLPPPNADGTLPATDASRLDALLYECSEARGWVQLGVAGLPYDDSRWRRFFIVDVRRMLDRLPRLRGVLLDFSSIADVSPPLLTLLDELRPVLASDARRLGVVMHMWEQPYFREVARRADQLVMPLEISASAFSRFTTTRAMRTIRDSLTWCEGRPLFFRLPSDRRLRRGLAALHLAFRKMAPPAEYQGVLLEMSPNTDASRWTEFRTSFLKP